MPTKFVEFSWDEGKTWEKLQISDEDILVENIILEPDSISQQFLVYGSYANIKGEPVHEKDDEDDLEDLAPLVNERRSYLTYLDFSSLHEP